MDKVKGLIVKDLLVLKSYKKTIILFIAIFIISALMQKDTELAIPMLITMITFGCSMFGITSFSYDELAKSDKFILTLPLTRKDIVISKYIVAFAATILGAILGVIVSSVVSVVVYKKVLDIMFLIIIASTSVGAIALLESIQIPCIIKYGAEKGRLQIFIIFPIIALIIGGIGMLLKKLNINIDFSSLAAYQNFLPLIMIAFTAVILYISYRVSYNIYMKKEV